MAFDAVNVTARLKPGDRYAESLTGMAGDIPVVKIVCVPCDEGQHATFTG